jgi:glycosyltransferase involved in cell wall biosynthesis
MSGIPLLTVVIPTRNAAADIERCLDSLAAQTSRDFAVCIVDAQSTDGTPERARAQALRAGLSLDCVSEPDAGVYDAMNKGIARSRSEWVYFLGADDILHDAQVLAEVAQCIANHGADIVYGDVIEKRSGARYGGAFSLDRLLFEGNLCHQSVFYRRSLFERLGGYSARYPIWADWDFNIRCFRHPDVRSLWFDRLIAVYQERTGLSGMEDPVLRRELPVFLLREAAGRRRRAAKMIAGAWRRLRGRLSRRPA